MSIEKPRRTLLALALAAVLALGASACGGNATKTITETGANGTPTTRTVPSVRFAKAKFVLHMGLAFGAFQRYILRPYRAGSFRRGAPGRTAALVKAGLAGAFAVRELKLARRAALSDPTLRPLADRVDALATRTGGLARTLKSGGLNPAQLLGVGGAVEVLRRAAQGAGVPIKDLATPSLGG